LLNIDLPFKTKHATFNIVLNTSHINPFSAKILIEFQKTIDNDLLFILKELILSWYNLGSFGAYNSLNLQLTDDVNNTIYNKQSYKITDIDRVANFDDIQFMVLDQEQILVKINLGTSDLLAFDILINCLIGFNEHHNSCLEKVSIY